VDVRQLMNQALESEPALTMNIDHMIARARRTGRFRSAVGLALSAALVFGVTGPPVTLPTSGHSSLWVFPH
jgi:hypothetical protein